MIKRVIFTLWILLFVTTGETWALFGPELSLGVRIGGSVFQDEKLSGMDTEIDTASSIGLTAAIRQGRWGGQLSVDWMSPDLEADTDLGELTIIPVLVTAQYHLLDEKMPIDPYVGLGVGYYANSFDTSDGIPDIEAEDSAGFHISGGTSVKISEALAFVFEALYAFTKVDLDSASTFDDDITLKTFLITGGVKYIFPR
jgi:opacity protein-like surface antigen